MAANDSSWERMINVGFQIFYLKRLRTSKITFAPKSTASMGIRSLAAWMVCEKLKFFGSGIGKKPYV